MGKKSPPPARQFTPDYFEAYQFGTAHREPAAKICNSLAEKSPQTIDQLAAVCQYTVGSLNNTKILPRLIAMGRIKASGGNAIDYSFVPGDIPPPPPLAPQVHRKPLTLAALSEIDRATIATADWRGVKRARAVVATIIAIVTHPDSRREGQIVTLELGWEKLAKRATFKNAPYLKKVLDAQAPHDLIQNEALPGNKGTLWRVPLDNIDALPRVPSGHKGGLLLPDDHHRIAIRAAAKSRFDAAEAAIVDAADWRQAGFKGEERALNAKAFVHRIGPERTAPRWELATELGGCSTNHVVWLANQAASVGWVSWEGPIYEGSINLGYRYRVDLAKITADGMKGHAEANGQDHEKRSALPAAEAVETKGHAEAPGKGLAPPDPPEPLRPHWDPDPIRRLTVGTVVIPFRKNAVDQIAILAAFEEQGWPEQIDSPAGLADWVKRRNAMTRLNDRDVLRFSSTMQGTAISWRFSDENSN